MLLQANKHSLLYGRNERSQRAVCTVLFLMAELCRCPSTVDDVRDGCNCTRKFCSAIRWVLYSLLSVVRKHMEKPTCFRISKSVRSPPAWLKVSPPPAWLEAAPPSSLLLSASELVSLPRPCLPRMEVFGGGIFIGGGM